MLTLAQRYRVQFHTEIEQGKTRVAADSKHILRVLVNLVHNAIKFTPSGGIVVIGTRIEEGGNMQTFFVQSTRKSVFLQKTCPASLSNSIK